MYNLTLEEGPTGNPIGLITPAGQYYRCLIEGPAWCIFEQLMIDRMQDTQEGQSIIASTHVLCHKCPGIMGVETNPNDDVYF